MGWVGSMGIWIILNNSRIKPKLQCRQRNVNLRDGTQGTLRAISRGPHGIPRREVKPKAVGHVSNGNLVTLFCPQSLGSEKRARILKWMASCGDALQRQSNWTPKFPSQSSLPLGCWRMWAFRFNDLGPLSALKQKRVIYIYIHVYPHIWNIPTGSHWNIWDCMGFIYYGL